MEEETLNTIQTPEAPLRGKVTDPNSRVGKYPARKNIRQLAENYSKDDKEIEEFVNFISAKFKQPMTRRNFLKIAGAAGTAVGLGLGYKYFKDDIASLWVAYQKEKSKTFEIVYTEEMTKLYAELEKFPDQEINDEDVKKNLDGINSEFRHAEFIKNSDKKEIDNLVDNIVANNNDVILFGEYHGVDSNAVNAAEILEKLKGKSNNKIAKIGLEFLDFNDPQSRELIEKFNSKQISSDDFYRSGYFRSDIRPLLEFAQKNNIPIDGLEDTKNFGYTGLERFTGMSHRVGAMVKEKRDDEIVVIFSGADHTTKIGWEEEKVYNHLSYAQPVVYTTKETAEDAVEKDYSFKEYLEKLGFNPAVIKLEDIDFLSQNNNNLFGYTFNFLKEEDVEQISKQWREEWQNYKLDKEKPFSINSIDGKNLYWVINPSEIPETPPALNVFEEIRTNFPPLHKLILKNNSVGYYPYKYEMSLQSQTRTPISAKMAEIDLKSGKTKKLFLPKQLKK